MAVTGKWYLAGREALYQKKIDWKNDDIRVILCTSQYIPDQINHKVLADITHELVNGGGYTTGGVPLIGRDEIRNTSAKKIALTASAPFTIPNSTITGARFAGIVDVTADVLLGYLDFITDQSTNNTEFRITWNAAGIFDDTIP